MNEELKLNWITLPYSAKELDQSVVVLVEAAKGGSGRIHEGRIVVGNTREDGAMIVSIWSDDRMGDPKRSVMALTQELADLLTLDQGRSNPERKVFRLEDPASASWTP